MNRLYLQKMNLKRPLSRSSRFKIYFRLECRRNQGSHQNFHEIPLSKKSHFNKTGLFVTYHLKTTCLFNKNKQSTSKYGCTKHKYKH